ncbi:hypothetical protein [Paludisphaera mucosa]|uniref:H repeat-associated protein N-terminal domain-containing protein n=1 Tax=Paludisphaera mucosa TaxID=3030827 RepID=A0ABT6F985_9BACT|nr:hypothetical protein [Paludisphaera mucosa]MDG3004141.1 hypothetical protein [Paludisphaera mucosa]
MNDDVERLLDQATPRPAPADLRDRVLRAVAEELAAAGPSRRPRRRFPVLAAVAAALIASVGLDEWTNRANDERLGRVFGPRPIEREAVAAARDVAAAAGPVAGRWVFERLAAPPPATTEADLRRHAADLERLLRDLTFDLREDDDEATPREIPQVGRDRDRPAAGRLLLVERLVHPGHGTPA